MGNDMGEIIQLYYRSIDRGPGKVVNNLIMGLDKFKVPYELNTPPKLGTIKVCLSSHTIMHTNIEELYIGPNICVLPMDSPIVMSQKYKKYLVNSNWTFNLYNKWISENKLDIWPVGIDTDTFRPNNEQEKVFDCLIYLKNRERQDLDFVTKFLTEKNQKFTVVEYGSYSEDSFKEKINKSKYCILIDSTESQGIAVQEMMSCGLPLLVWDVEFWNERDDNYKFKASSVPYWNDKCGYKFYKKEDLTNFYENFIEKFDEFNPRKFVLDHLSIEVCTKKFLDIVQYNT